MFMFKDFTTILKPDNSFEYLPEEIELMCNDAIYVSMELTARLYSDDSFDSFFKECEEKYPKVNVIPVKRFMYENAFRINSTKEFAKRLRAFYKKRNNNVSSRKKLKATFLNRGESVYIVFENDLEVYTNSFSSFFL